MHQVEINTESDIVTARSKGREMARELGFGIANQTRLATAISELTRNVIRYAGNGVCGFLDTSGTVELSIRVVVEDRGPGIENLEQAMSDGFSTGKSLGAGLPGTRRLVREMVVESAPGHTKITIEVAQLRG